jgi:hypothetical protein
LRYLPGCTDAGTEANVNVVVEEPEASFGWAGCSYEAGDPGGKPPRSELFTVHTGSRPPRPGSIHTKTVG